MYNGIVIAHLLENRYSRYSNEEKIIEEERSIELKTVSPL